MQGRSFREILTQQVTEITGNGLSRGEIQLEPHQLRGYGAICRALESTHANAYNLIMACGSGKTWMEVGLLRASTQAKKLTGMDRPDMLIYTENAIRNGVLETLDQEGLDYGIWQGGKKPTDRAITVASIQVLQRTQERIHLYFPSDVPLIVGDEADLLVTEKRKNFLSGFTGLKFGFSATNSWPNGRSITDAWGDTIFRYDLAEAIADRVVLKPKYQLLQSSVSMDALPRESGEYPVEELDRVLVEAEVYSGIVKVYESLVNPEKMKEYPTIVVVPSVNLVRRTSQEFRKKYGRDINIRWWTGEDSTGKTVDMDIEAYKGGEVDILIVCEMGGRGMNLPNARLLIDASCSVSLTKISQLHPRVMRRDRANPEKKQDCIIVQILPTTIQSKPKTFFDILEQGGETDGKKSHQGIQREESLFERLPIELLEGLRASLDTKGNHTLKLVDSFQMESETVYNLNEDGTVLYEDGKLYAPIEYFMKLFGISTASIVKDRISKYMKSGNTGEGDGDGKRGVNLNIEGVIRIKTIYPVEPIKTVYESQKRSTLVTDSRGCYTDPNGRKYYSKTELRRMTGTRANDDYFSLLEPLGVLLAGTNRPLAVYSFDDYVAQVTKTAVTPNEAMAYIYNDEYQDMKSLEAEFPDLTRNFTPKDFNAVLKHKPWNSEVGTIEYIWLVRIADVAYMYRYIASLPEVTPLGEIIWRGDDYLTPGAIESKYNVPVNVLERALGGKIAKIPVRLAYRPTDGYLKHDTDRAFRNYTIKKANLAGASEGVCTIDGQTYYTTNYIAGIYGFSNSQIIEVFREHKVEPLSLSGVRVYLYSQADTERVFSRTDFYPNSAEELHIDGRVYIDEKYLTLHFSEAVARATLAVVPGTMIQSKTGYRVIGGTKKGSSFYEKELTVKIANGIARTLKKI